MAQELPIFNVVGEHVALGPLRHELIPLYQRWINDFSIARGVSSLPRPWTFEMESAWVERQLVSETSTPFTIYECRSTQPIGTTELRDLDFRNRTAEFGLLIGETSHHGKGYGTEVTRLMLDYGFTALGLHNIMLRVFAYNAAGLRVYEKAGFQEFGRRRQVGPLGNQVWDLVFMDCLSTEFRGSALSRVFTPDPVRSMER